MLFCLRRVGIFILDIVCCVCVCVRAAGERLEESDKTVEAPLTLGGLGALTIEESEAESADGGPPSDTYCEREGTIWLSSANEFTGELETEGTGEGEIETCGVGVDDVEGASKSPLFFFLFAAGWDPSAFFARRFLCIFSGSSHHTDCCRSEKRESLLAGLRIAADLGDNEAVNGCLSV